MTDRTRDVGAQDPELRNSPIAYEGNEESQTLRGSVAEIPVCYFNGEAYEDGTVVRSGTSLLRCDKGLWIPSGSSDPDNP